MSTDTQTPPPSTIQVDPDDLADHPLLAHIPVWAKDSEEFKSLRESLRSDGQLYEILIDSENRVVDGRNRRNALASLMRDATCRVVADADVSTIIFRTLMQRRHVTKGARAFLAVPLVKPLIEAARARHLALLKSGARGPSPIESEKVPTIERIALDVGVSADVFEQARHLHEELVKYPADVRERITAEVIEGTLGLGYACTSLANIRDAATRATKLGARQQHDALFSKALPKLSLHWEKANEEQRGQIVEGLRSSVTLWPIDLLHEAQTAIQAALKRAKV